MEGSNKELMEIDCEFGCYNCSKLRFKQDLAGIMGEISKILYGTRFPIWIT